MALAALLCLAVWGSAFPAPARAQQPGGGAPAELRKVRVGFYIYNVSDLDIKERRFSLDFYIWIRFPGEGAEYEKLDFVNGKIDHIEEQDRRVEGGHTYVSWRVAATFHQNFRLEDYPFDRQHLTVILEHPYLENYELLYEHDIESYERSLAPRDRWGIWNGLTIPEWKVIGTRLGTSEYLYETDFGWFTGPGQLIGSKYSRLTLSIDIERISLPYFFKIILPLALVLAIAYLAFFIPPSELGAAVAVALFSLLATVVLYTTVSSNLPEAGYLVASDKFFIATIGMIFLNLVQSVWTYNLARRGRDEDAFRIEIACRIIFPIVYAAAFASVFVLTLMKDR